MVLSACTSAPCKELLNACSDVSADLTAGSFSTVVGRARTETCTACTCCSKSLKVSPAAAVAAAVVAAPAPALAAAALAAAPCASKIKASVACAGSTTIAIRAGTAALLARRRPAAPAGIQSHDQVQTRSECGLSADRSESPDRGVECTSTRRSTGRPVGLAVKAAHEATAASATHRRISAPDVSPLEHGGALDQQRYLFFLDGAVSEVVTAPSVL
jgi:hypothetical protein